MTRMYPLLSSSSPQGKARLTVWTPDMDEDQPFVDLSLVPYLPTYENFHVVNPEDHNPEHLKYQAAYACFHLGFLMLKSVNKKSRTTNTSRVVYTEPAYRAREKQEIERITRQREYVDYPVMHEHERYMASYIFSVRTELRTDNHNFLKPTCDLFGKGRKETIGSGMRKRKVWVDHAQLIWDDNRVSEDGPKRLVVPKGQGPLWCHCWLFRYHERHRDNPYLSATIGWHRLYATHEFLYGKPLEELLL